MAILTRGTCVGVLYRANQGASCNTSGYCVHNGRLVGGVLSIDNNTIRVSRTVNNANLQQYRGIILSHLAINANNPSGRPRQQYLYFTTNQLRKVLRTPYYGSCQTATRDNVRDIIYPGECVGIMYYDVNANRYNVHLGRYLYWVGQRRHCILDERPQSTNRQFLRAIWYSHWILDPANPANIIPTPTSRSHAMGERRIFVYKLRIPANGQSIRIQRVPGSRQRPRRIIYQ
ncbi:hypothetical protein JOC94_004242 [Bacillus thermophilus]|uniref:Uncharacterized protein n=2 Tax=Siminovitchia TaxID=2837510 RepID=A0ABS2RC29_9BACI|nr:hypothetical protein [Siminovitchia thermophila]MBM7717217.1 hypothetical protein [Siminovitchia thermophila]